MDRLSFPLEIAELEPGTRGGAQGLRDRSLRRGSPRRARRRLRAGGGGAEGPLQSGAARASWGSPKGRCGGEIHRGRAVTLGDGRVIEPSVLVGAPRPGRQLVAHRRHAAVRGHDRDAAQGADLLVHEATFGDEEQARAVETGHSTAREAARVARPTPACAPLAADALLRALLARRVGPGARGAGGVSSATVVGKDGMELEVAYRDATP